MSDERETLARVPGEGDASARSLRPVVFLDRDGVLNEEKGYIYNVDDLILIPGAAPAVVRLNDAGVACVVVTNQSGPARGFYPVSHVESLNGRLIDLLAMAGARVDALYYCPHHSAGVVPELSFACGCRKPATGMIERAFAELDNLDRTKAYMVGDQSTDIDLARNAGISGVLVKTGHGEKVESGEFQWQVDPDHCANSLAQAVDWILDNLKARKGP